MFELPIPPLFEGFGRVQRDLASRHGVALIPKRILLSLIEAADATVDSLHLTQQGHDRMAAVVWALLEPAIREAAGQAEPGDGADRARVLRLGERAEAGVPDTVSDGGA